MILTNSSRVKYGFLCAYSDDFTVGIHIFDTYFYAARATSEATHKYILDHAGDSTYSFSPVSSERKKPFLAMNLDSPLLALPAVCTDIQTDNTTDNEFYDDLYAKLHS